jgi:2-dehydro-3-deoxygluconokinase
MRDEPRSIAQAGLHFAPTVIMKVGADGCFIATGESAAGEGVVHLPAEQASPADTTGAGDSFAGGYLYGLVSGLAPRDCGRLANRLAAAIVEVEGCSYAKIDRSAVLAGAL